MTEPTPFHDLDAYIALPRLGGLALSPDGSRVAFISDRSGEEEIWITAQDGLSKPEQLTNGGSAMEKSAVIFPSALTAKTFTLPFTLER